MRRKQYIILFIVLKKLAYVLLEMRCVKPGFILHFDESVADTKMIV